MPTIYEKRRPQIMIWPCFWAMCRNYIPQGNCDFFSIKCLINVNCSSRSTGWAVENLKPWVMLRPFGTNAGLTNQNFEKTLISRAIRLGFLRYFVSATRCEANKSNKQRQERPIGSRAIKMLRDLWRRARGLAQMRAPKWEHVCTTDRHDSRAQNVAWWLTRKRDLLAENQLNKTKRVEGEISMVQSVQLGFSRLVGSTASNEANKSAMWHEALSSAPLAAMIGPNETVIFCPRMLQAERNFFQLQAITTGHISIIYRQTGDILFTSMYCFSDAGAALTAKSPLSHCILPESEILKLDHLK